MKKQIVLVRTARHYEGAAAVLVRVATGSATRFVAVARAPPGLACTIGGGDDGGGGFVMEPAIARDLVFDATAAPSASERTKAMRATTACLA